jgi:hypothetical protein
MKAELNESGAFEGEPRRGADYRLSEVFARLAQTNADRVSVASIRDALGDRSFAALLTLFAAINMIPMPPGTSAFLGIPLLIISAQMAYGSERAWLPRFIMDRSLSAEQFRTVMDRVVPRLQQIEKLIKPRYWPFWRRQGDRIIGIMSFVLALVLTLPIPLGNWPPAFAMALLGLSLIERDGILFALGTAMALISLAIVVAVFGVAGVATGALFSWIF